MNINKDQERQILDEINREESANKILNNPEFKRVFIEYTAQLLDSLTSTQANEVEKREDIYRQMKSLNVVEGKFIKALQTGSLARQTLSNWQKLANNTKKIIGL
jgi:hypothetical protein